MHFLGAVITELKEDLYEVLDPWCEDNRVPLHVVQTREEFLAASRDEDRQTVEAKTKWLQENDGASEEAEWIREYMAEARERLALDDDEQALQAYAKWYGKTLNGNGDVVSTFNEDSFYDWWEPADDSGWKTRDGLPYAQLQGKTCREILARHPEVLDEVYVAVANGDHIGGYCEPATTEDVERMFREHPASKVWWVNFHE